MNIPTPNAVAVVSSFATGMSVLADKADNQAITSTCAVLLLVRDSGGTNKKSAGALWALLSENIVTTFAQAKRINGALNAPSDKATNGAKQVRAIWLGAKNQTAFVKGLLDIGVQSPRSMLDMVAPRGDKKESVKKSAVETFLLAANAEGFKEDVTDLLVWVAERHAKQMRGLLSKEETFQAGVLKDAAQKRAAIEAKQEKAKAAKAAKEARDAERTRIHAEKMAKIGQEASAEKSTKAQAAHAEKIARERALRNREIIEA